jgi:hypothetical protein
MVPDAVAVIAAPIKSNLETLFAVPTNTLSLNTEIPFTRVAGESCNQYLSYTVPSSIVTRR